LIVANPPKVFIGTGYVPNEMEDWLVQEYGRCLFNAYYLKHSRKYWKLVEIYQKHANETMLDNGAYQAWKHGKRFFSPDILLHYARKIKPTYVIIPDIIKDFSRSRQLAEKYANWQNEFKCIVVLHGASVGKEELLKDIKFYKSLGYEYFGYTVESPRELIKVARENVPYLHGLGFNFNLYFKYPYFDSIDVGSYRLLWVFRNLFQKSIIKET